MINFKKYLLLIIVPLLVTGCNREKPLIGPREPIDGITYNGLDVSPSKNVVINTNSSTRLNNNLQILWKRSIGKKPILSNIVTDNNNLYIMDSNGYLNCINKNNGRIVYKKFITKAPSSGTLYGIISINNGIIYIGTNTNEVVTFSTKNRNILWNKKLDNSIKGTPVCFKDKVIVNTIDNSTYALNKNNGEIIWNYALNEEPVTMLSTSSPLLYNNNLILTYSSGDIVSLNINDGDVKWSEVLIPNYVYNSGAGLLQPIITPIQIGDNVLISNVNSMMVLLDADLGTKIWEKKIGTATNPIIVNNKWIFVIANNNVLCIDINTGNTQWKVDLKEMFKKDRNYKNSFWYGPLLVNNQLWIFSTNADILKLDLSTGKVIEKQYIHHVFYTDTPVLDNNKLLAQVRGNIYALQ